MTPKSRIELFGMGPACATIYARANRLIAEAERAGVVLTIALTPHQPLAMRNYEMVADVRQARGDDNSNRTSEQ